MTFIIGAGSEDVFARHEDRPWHGALVAPGERSFQPVAAAGHFTPAGDRYRALDDAGREALIAELALALSACDDETKARMIRGFTAVDVDYGRRIFEALNGEAALSATQ